jgi:hypothetical protein
MENLLDDWGSLGEMARKRNGRENIYRQLLTPSTILAFPFGMYRTVSLTRNFDKTRRISTPIPQVNLVGKTLKQKRAKKFQ